MKKELAVVGRTLSETRQILAAHQYVADDTPVKADLFEIMYQFGDELNDYSTCYFGHAAVNFAPKKMKAAEDIYAKKLVPGSGVPQTNLNGFVVLVDETTFGKGDEGFYVTEQAIFGRKKELFSDEVKFGYDLLDIEDISVDEKHLHINGKSYEYTGVSVGRMQIIVQCIQTYISQFD